MPACHDMGDNGVVPVGGTAPANRLACRTSLGYEIMGCLPGLILFLLATAGGWWLGGPNGVLWGATIGAVAGLAATVALIMLMRRASRGLHTRNRGASMHEKKN